MVLGFHPGYEIGGSSNTLDLLKGLVMLTSKQPRINLRRGLSDLLRTKLP